MSISHDDVERIIRLLDASEFDELHLEIDGLSLDLRRRGSSSAATALPSRATAAVVPTPAAAPTRAVVHGTGAARSKLNGSAAAPSDAALERTVGAIVDIKAPMLGTFFRAPKPGAEPFIAVGSRVEPQTVIGIVEVMKLMNSVAAGVNGEVVEILASDARLVEYDEVLVRIRPH